MALTTHIALLRAVNVGGRKLIMSELRTWLEGLGFQDVRTLLQSGNLVFHSKEAADRKLTAKLEAEAEKTFGFDIDFLVRTAAEWDAVIAANPYPQAAENDPARLVVMALNGVPSPDAVEALRAWIPGRETLQAHGRELYIVYPDGQGESKLVITVIERKLGLRGTARNWNTTLKLAALAREIGAA
jgi:uncharacterized protein (DUF1697 family)